MSAAFQIFGIGLAAFGVALFTYVFLGPLCAVGVFLVGVGTICWLVGKAFEYADEVSHE